MRRCYEDDISHKTENGDTRGSRVSRESNVGNESHDNGPENGYVPSYDITIGQDTGYHCAYF